MSRTRVKAVKFCLTVLLCLGLVTSLWAMFLSPATTLAEKSGTQEVLLAMNRLPSTDEAAAPLWEYIERKNAVRRGFSFIYGAFVAFISGFGIYLLPRARDTERNEA